MTPTENRLRDTLTATARTIERVPDFAAPTTRRLLPRPLAAALASAAVVASIAYLAAPDPVRTEAAAPPAGTFQLTAYLCVRTSSQPTCGGKDTTPAQRDAVAARLSSLPEVHGFRYESSEEAFERFRVLFADTPGMIAAAEPGDIPDSFRIRADPADVPTIEAALSPLPGIDQIINEDELRARHPGTRS
ncbi:hypothetical protein EDD29_6978 [Actinocorallia herbida]|uniref:FtsX extracellular domain-containing protein n=1 Tax=Actinocorallia herbida TaxID=58109 RepID=A0A3N1D747_9ACTN|nr:permease-like cell division protein FtsX [Actinocorallia herbida]ROO89289.1 hypothetical protein EDD29_6978 [Actinocorallia herbida]